MGGQQRTPPGRMVLLTISVALLSIFASPGSCQEIPAESGSGNGSNHSVMASNTYVYSSNQTAESGSGHGSNHSAMASNHSGMLQPLELSEHGEVPGEIPDDKCCSEKTVGGIHYKLVGTGETEVYNCLGNCIYHSSSFPRDVWQYCFRPGKQPVECNDA